MHKNSTRKTLMIVTALVWVAAIAASFNRFKLAAKPPLTISLLTEPRNIRLAVDGHVQQGGAYQTTPLSLNLKPGKHRIKVMRDGYIAHAISIEGESGNHYKLEDVVLQKDPQAVFTVLRVEAPRNKQAVYIAMDDGLLQGELPFESEEEVTTDTEHTLSVYPKWPRKTPASHCRFLIPESAAPGGQTVTLRISKAGAVRFSGCDKLSEGER